MTGEAYIPAQPSPRVRRLLAEAARAVVPPPAKRCTSMMGDARCRLPAGHRGYHHGGVA